MDDRENGRHKADQYKSAQGQWLMQQHQHQHPSMKQIMAIMAERDAAIQERNLALSEKKAALAERDMAFLQRDTAIAERNNALMERDNAIATLQFRENALANGGMSSCPPGCQISRGVKHIHHLPQQQQVNHLPTMGDPSYGTRELHTTNALPEAPIPSEVGKPPRRAKRPKESKSVSPNKKTPKTTRKVKKEGEDLNKTMFANDEALEWKSSQEIINGGDDLNKQLAVSKADWKPQDLALNQVAYDDSTMPAPVCSCTGVLRQCYKWGNGGWQSACCTTTLSVYPLPAVPNKRHARVGGRKMSGSAFNKLLSRLAAEGHDLSHPVDLKDHWAKHGTNRYITIK